MSRFPVGLTSVAVFRNETASLPALAAEMTTLREGVAMPVSTCFGAWTRRPRSG
jgi:hypothetical protein